MMGDLLGGKLIDPEVGQWAWYDVTDAETGKSYVLRQAVVGEEKVKRKQGYWVEFEIVPQEGYRLLYKVLLIGPANDPDSVHRVLRKNGPDPVETVFDAAAGRQPGDRQDEQWPKRPKRKSLGMETVETVSGLFRAERFDVDQEGKRLTVWIDERVKPTGIVKIESQTGTMLLRDFGVGGNHAESRLGAAVVAPPGKRRPKVTVEAESK
jgi:hypothetical protein